MKLKDLKEYEVPGGYKDSTGKIWDTPIDMLTMSEDWLGFCGCGTSEEIEYIAEGLKAIGNGHDHSVEYFGTAAAAQFFYKVADDKGLTNHGGSVPGWVDDKGRQFIRIAKQARAEGWE